MSRFEDDMSSFLGSLSYRVKKSHFRQVCHAYNNENKENYKRNEFENDERNARINYLNILISKIIYIK
jgi:hypothetical protein